MNTVQTFTKAFAATTAVPFARNSDGTNNNYLPLGVAKAILVTATLSSGITLALVDGTTVALGNQTLGTIIPISCTMATFAAGTCVALA
jgi:hypothetical protein